MKLVRDLILSISGLALAAILLCSATDGNSAQPKIAVVNFKHCVDESKVGKLEQSQFEALQKQMELSLEEKGKALTEISEKFNDPDYLDSLSADAETDLKRKFRTMSQEYQQTQAQYYQALQQTNMKVLQKLHEATTKAASKVAQKEGIDIVLTEESAFYYNPGKDISSKVIAILDEEFEKEEKEAKEAKGSLN